MSLKLAIVCSLAIYCILSLLFAGSILSPIVWHTRAGQAGTVCLALAGLGALIVVYLQPWLKSSGKLPLFVLCWMLLTVMSLVPYEDMVRGRALAALNADAVLENSFLWSMRNTPEEWQFEVHSLALKNCKVYSWSYRNAAFYELVPNIAVNVVPNEWVKRCNIKRQ